MGAEAEKTAVLSSREKVTVAILARNEEATIEKVIMSAASCCGDVIVIDGNSTDLTRELARAAGARVYRDGGRGKGDGIRKAIEVARGEVIVFSDADGSHDPNDIPALAAPIITGRADLVVGSRWRGGSDELAGDIAKFVRSTGSAIIALVINYRWNIRLTDVENGFRAISTEAARDLELKEHGFTIEQEMIMKCLRRGYRVTEVATHEYVRQSGHSQLKVYKVWHRFLWCLLRNLIK
ncbi:MAG: glycosyltransferase family 2 protein [Thermoleophilia bacterium]|nr:glycosyltransferase family 2 protein [Thermoleophilia bacterium]